MKYRIIEVDHYSAYKVPLLMHLVYGTSFSQRELYNTSEICKLIELGLAIFYIAENNQGNPLALLGLRFYSNNKTSAEFIPFVTDPLIRGIESGYLLKCLVEAFEPKINHLKTEGSLKTLYALATTDHPLVIEFCNFLGFTLSGIYLAWTAVGSCMPDIKQLQLSPDLASNKETVISGRRTDLLYTRVLHDKDQPYEIFIPKQFDGILKKIYTDLKLPVKYVTKNKVIYKNTSLNVIRDTAGKRTVIDVEKIADDLSQCLLTELNYIIKQQIDIIQINLPLTQCDISDITEILINRGCRFCGLMPFHNGQDVLILQLVNCPLREVPDLFLKKSRAQDMYDLILT